MLLLFSIIRDAFIVLDVLLLFGFVWALAHAWKFRPNFDFKQTPGSEKKIGTLRARITQERWQAIVKKFALGTAEALRLSVIEADTLVDSVLKGMGLEGEHMADRLGNLDAGDLKSMDNLWRAHRMRNDLVHTPGFTLAPKEAKMALDGYEAFLEELGALTEGDPPPPAAHG